MSLLLHLFVSVWNHRCLFYTLGYNLRQLNLVYAQIFQLLLLKLFKLTPMSLWCIPIIMVLGLFVCFWAPPYSLSPWDDSSSCIFPILVLESAISSKGSGSFYWRMTLEMKIWALGMAIVTELSVARPYQLTEQGYEVNIKKWTISYEPAMNKGH